MAYSMKKSDTCNLEKTSKRYKSIPSFSLSFFDDKGLIAPNKLTIMKFQSQERQFWSQGDIVGGSAIHRRVLHLIYLQIDGNK